jgi:hypothetical protein
MSGFKVIAVENPFMISFLPSVPVKACVLFNNEIYISSNSELFKMDTYEGYIDVVDHAVKEGKYEWADFNIKQHSFIDKDFDGNIIIDKSVVEPFKTLDDTGNKEISNRILTLFNEFLRHCNKDNLEMVEALNICLKDGFFRKEVNEIVENDIMDKLSNLDKEIIVRSKIEGTKYITNYVKRLLKSSAHDKYIDINYFFRRIFNLERFNYIKF